MYNCFILQDEKRGLKDTVYFFSKKTPLSNDGFAHTLSQSLEISQVLTKALRFCASENSLTALFGNYRKCYSCNKFHEKIIALLMVYVFCSRNFLHITIRLLYSEYYFREQRNSLQYITVRKYMFSIRRKNSWLRSLNVRVCLYD